MRNKCGFCGFATILSPENGTGAGCSDGMECWNREAEVMEQEIQGVVSFAALMVKAMDLNMSVGKG